MEGGGGRGGGGGGGIENIHTYIEYIAWYDILTLIFVPKVIPAIKNLCPQAKHCVKYENPPS